MLQNFFCASFAAVYDNSLDAYIPELWAQESLAILEENMVAAALVHRDFEPYIANYGDVVNTRRPAEFTGKRKTDNDDVTVQDASATNVPVPLDQQVHVSFLIRDGQESKGFKNLVQEYLSPAMLAQARFIDKIVLGQFPQFLANGAGKLGGMTTSTVKGDILDVRKVMNNNKAYDSNRNLIWNPNSETLALNTDIFLQANTTGDGGLALREAMLGRKLGFNHYMCQNMASIATTTDVTIDLLVDNTAGYPVGTTTMVVDGHSGALTANMWFTVAGDETPHRIVSTSGGSTPVGVTFTPALKHAVVNNAIITIYNPGAVNFSGGYAAGYAKDITYASFSTEPVAGQIVTFGVTSTDEKYSIISVDQTANTFVLDRPLASAVADAAIINIGPSGDYNFAFHRNALALVVRPLAMPMAGTGALSSVVNHNGLSMRATITYNGTKQGHLVTLDMLCGVATLDTNLGAVLYG